LFTIAGVIEPFPEASRFTVNVGLQFATGATASTTVTVAVHVETLGINALSVTVKVTVFGPTFAQVKAVCDKLKDAIPQLSDEPLLTAAAVVDPFPVASRFTVTL
jgi:hypothetical protein